MLKKARTLVIAVILFFVLGATGFVASSTTTNYFLNFETVVTVEGVRIGRLDGFLFVNNVKYTCVPNATGGIAKEELRYSGLLKKSTSVEIGENGAFVFSQSSGVGSYTYVGWGDTVVVDGFAIRDRVKARAIYDEKRLWAQTEIAKVRGWVLPIILREVRGKPLLEGALKGCLK